jgi:nucleotide-binding universal stress UspA family protein
MFKHILVPSDGSDGSRHAAEIAVELAKRLGARITVLHVIQPQTVLIPDATGGYTYLMPDDIYEKAAKTQAERIFGEVRELATAAGVACETAAPVGAAPWQTIIDTAKSRGCDAIVMASHGRRGLAALVLGSETTKVLTHCALPVLVTR